MGAYKYMIVNNYLWTFMKNYDETKCKPPFC